MADPPTTSSRRPAGVSTVSMPIDPVTSKGILLSPSSVRSLRSNTSVDGIPQALLDGGQEFLKRTRVGAAVEDQLLAAGDRFHLQIAPTLQRVIDQPRANEHEGDQPCFNANERPAAND